MRCFILLITLFLLVGCIQQSYQDHVEVVDPIGAITGSAIQEEVVQEVKEVEEVKEVKEIVEVVEVEEPSIVEIVDELEPQIEPELPLPEPELIQIPQASKSQYRIHEGEVFLFKINERHTIEYKEILDRTTAKLRIDEKTKILKKYVPYESNRLFEIMITEIHENLEISENTVTVYLLTGLGVQRETLEEGETRKIIIGDEEYTIEVESISQWPEAMLVVNGEKMDLAISSSELIGKQSRLIVGNILLSGYVKAAVDFELIELI